MKTLIWFLSILLMSMFYSSSNPVKTMMMLMVLSIIMFLSLYIFSSSSWFSIFFFMLFIGGIMIMFMILASLMPNEKSMKFKMLWLPTVLMMIFLACVPQEYFTNLSAEYNVVNQMKWFFQSMYSFEFLVIMILLYFFSFIFLLSKDYSSMRSEL